MASASRSKKGLAKMVIVKKAKAKGELFEALRSLRKELATKEKLPPYMIFLMLHLHRWQQINQLI